VTRCDFCDAPAAVVLRIEPLAPYHVPGGGITPGKLCVDHTTILCEWAAMMTARYYEIRRHEKTDVLH